MATPKRTKGISAQTEGLLREGESERVDFKRAPDGISADDVVAFANIESGGVILAGVDERAGSGGIQIGFVVGCDVSDATVLQITNKALSCVPPIAIEVSIENISKKPFLKITVPPSSTRPHCTPKGVYCRRDGNRNRALHPSELLKIFLESEARAFAERFESAADRIAQHLTQLESSLEESIDNMSSQLGWADSKLGNTESTIDSVYAYVHRINTETNDLTTRMRSLFRQDKRQDPIHDRERKKFLDAIVEQLVKDKELYKNIFKGGTVSVSPKGKAALELSKDDLEKVLREAVQIVTDKLEQEKYSTEIKRPNKCSKEELRSVAELIVEGGEVAAGIEGRLKTAAALGLVCYDKKLIGIAGLKKPAANYKASVFEKAGATAEISDFPLELGWLFVKKEHRRKGQIQPLVEKLLEVAGARGVFATTRAANDKMQRILKHQHFFQEGSPYPSTQKPGEEILLFVRRAKPVK